METIIIFATITILVGTVLFGIYKIHMERHEQLEKLDLPLEEEVIVVEEKPTIIVEEKQVELKQATVKKRQPRKTTAKPKTTPKK